MGMALSVGANRTAETRLESGDYKKLPNAGIQKLLNLKQGLSKQLALGTINGVASTAKIT